MKTIVITLITICALIAWTNALAFERLPTGIGSEGVAINSRTQIAVVTSKSYAELGKKPVDTGTLSIIDLKTKQIINTIEVGGVPVGPAINENTNTVVFSDKANNEVVILDLTSGTETARIAVGENPSCADVDSEHNLAVVASTVDSKVYVIDLASASIKHTIEVGANPVCMHWSINPKDMTAIVANMGADTLTVMDIENGSVLKTIPVGQGPGPGPSLNPETNTAVVPFMGNNVMAIVDINSGTVTHTVPVGAAPVCSVIDGENNIAFISNYGDGSVSAIDIDTGTLISTIEGVGEGSTCMAIDATQNLLLVTNHGGDVALIELDDILGAIPTKDFSNTFFVSLELGLNMISLPLEPVVQYTARSLAEEIGATAVIRYDTTLGKFVGFTPAASDDGFALNGGEGYIVNVPDGGVVAFAGAAWTNEPPVAAPPAQTSGAWAFVVSGWVLDGDLMSANDGDYTAVVKNLRTGEMFTESVDPSGYFAVAWADLNRRAVIGAGDRVEVAVMDSSGSIVSGPFAHEVTLDSIRDAVVKVHLNLGDIIPAKSVLLQNYPNPFNPETWIPYHLSDASPVMVRIYSASGQLIRTLDLGYRDAGVYASRSKAAYWDGRNEAGEEVASAVYFYSITAGDFSATRKMIVKK